jgi:5'-3' exonuclease
MFDENNWRSTYYKHLFDSNIVTNTVMKASENYLDGIIWNVGYYFNKKHMKKWFYVYNYSPTILDLWNYVTSMTSEESIKKLNLNIESIFNDININEDEQLLLVLPPQSLNIISKDYTDLLDINSGICHLYPSKFEIMTYQKSKLHTCFPILPSLEYNSINKYILSCKKSI